MRKAVLVIGLLALAVGPALAGTLASVTMPDTITVGNRTLVLNGMGLRTKWFVKVYVAGLYLEKKSSDAGGILQADATRRIVLQFMRGVSREQMVEAFDEALSANGGAMATSLKSEIAQFLKTLEPMKEKEQFVVTYVPGTGTIVSVRGTDKATIPGQPFGQLVFSMWLGPKPPSADLKKGLLGGK